MQGETMVKRLGVVLFVSMGIVACVSDEQQLVGDDGGGASTDGGTIITDADISNEAALPNDSATTPDAEDAASKACNALDPNDAPAIANVSCSTNPPVVPTAGGTIPPGKYFLTTSTFYLGSAAACADAGLSAFHAVAIISNADGGGSVDVDSANDFGAGVRRNVHWSITSTGVIAATNICPNTASSVVKYEVAFPASGIVEVRQLEGNNYRVFRSY